MNEAEASGIDYSSTPDVGVLNVDPGVQIDPSKLTLESEIGAGASGVVVQGKLRLKGKIISVAVKMIAPRPGKGSQRQFENEVERLIEASKNCSGVTKFYGVCRKKNTFCLVMKLYSNTVATILLQNTKGLPTATVMKYMSMLIRTLADLHEKGIAHQDLKPANLFIDNDDCLIVGDFGIATVIATMAASGRRSTLGTRGTLGTLNYMSPEAFDEDEFGQVGLETDIWGFAACVLEMSTGKPPFQSMSIGQILNQIVNLKNPPQTPENSPFESIFRLCFNFDQTQRPTAQDLTSFVELHYTGTLIDATLAHPATLHGAGFSL